MAHLASIRVVREQGITETPSIDRIHDAVLYLELVSFHTRLRVHGAEGCQPLADLIGLLDIVAQQSALRHELQWLPELMAPHGA